MIELGCDGRPRGLCMECTECTGWAWSERELPPKEDHWRGTIAAHAAASGGAPFPQVNSNPYWQQKQARGNEFRSLCDGLPYFNGRTFSFPLDSGDCMSGGCLQSQRPCGCCGCPEHSHEDVTRRFGRLFAQCGKIPIEALHWSQVEVALWGDTGGLFHPDDYRNKLAAKKNANAKRKDDNVLVSVICPTTSSRRCFHPFLWMCFATQTYAPRELIIIDTCEDEPSQLFEQMMQKDARVTYLHFHVPETQWSIGLKRNLACYLASGQVIAHFDDDDLYASCYLEDMVKYMHEPREAFIMMTKSEPNHDNYQQMLASMGQPSERSSDEAQLWDEVAVKSVLGKFGAACAKLCSWHMFSLQTRGWEQFDSVKGNSSRENQIYGWGFSFLYLRAAWAACPFLHIGLGEDLDFMLCLRRLGMPVILVPDSKGICAHTLHVDNTAITCASNDARGGSSGMLYSPMGPLLPAYLKAAADLYDNQQRKQSVEGKRS